MGGTATLPGTIGIIGKIRPAVEAVFAVGKDPRFLPLFATTEGGGGCLRTRLGATKTTVLRQADRWFQSGISTGPDGRHGWRTVVIQGRSFLVARSVAGGIPTRSILMNLVDLITSQLSGDVLGKLGGLIATPVVNYPEVAILYVGEMKKKPIIKDDQIVIGKVMNVGVSFDHRIVDGYEGAEFTQGVIALLQNPEKLLLAL
jgi:hypothetical protein